MSRPITAEVLAAMSRNERSAFMASQPMRALEDLPESTRHWIGKGEEVERRLGR